MKTQIILDGKEFATVETPECYTGAPFTLNGIGGNFKPGVVKLESWKYYESVRKRKQLKRFYGFRRKLERRLTSNKKQCFFKPGL